MTELYAKNIHFLGESEKEQKQDLCVHGNVCFKINDTVISDGNDDEWCISASALRFLRSLFNDHISGKEEHIIPCCGHFMVPSEDGKSVEIIGCPNGIDFDVIRKGDDIVIPWNKAEMTITYPEYKNAVLAYAEQIIDFYDQNPERSFNDEYDKNMFMAFMTEFKGLYNKAIG